MPEFLIVAEDSTREKKISCFVWEKYLCACAEYLDGVCPCIEREREFQFFALVVGLLYLQPCVCKIAK